MGAYLISALDGIIVAQASLRFGFLQAQDPADFGPVVATVRAAIEKGRIFRRSKNLVLFFMEPHVRVVQGREMFVVYFAYAQGATYRAPDPTTGELVDWPYDAPPYKARAMVLVDEDGNVVVEVKKTGYIDPSRVVEALDKTVRRHGDFNSPFSLRLKDVPKESRFFEDALTTLKRLDVVAIENLRHSNPRPRSKHYDDVANQRIQRIRYASDHPAGIDREHPEFRNFLDHVRDYASYKEIAGMGPSSYEILRSEAGELQLTIELPADADDNVKVEAIYRYASRYLVRPEDSGET